MSTVRLSAFIIVRVRFSPLGTVDSASVRRVPDEFDVEVRPTPPPR